MSEERDERARERMRRLHEQRKAMGICVRCSGMIDNPQYAMCSKCLAKRREESANYRDKLKKLREKCEVVVPETEEISEDHKCWTCVWSRFEGDRFFCPLVGTCVKDEAKQEE